MKKTVIILLLMLIMPCVSMAKATDLKPRLVVCTDIAPAEVEPDDMESMVRLMAYADLFEIEALITSVGWNCDPYPTEWAEYLFRVVEAYRKDVPNLMKRAGQTFHIICEVHDNGPFQLASYRRIILTIQ
ncbi:MAG: DUF1593 domain-containing protein [Bacteroidaceae bacterium]|nr:DUF1593 domain-containing protein [Bacteroidaceae bacterium]